MWWWRCLALFLLLITPPVQAAFAQSTAPIVQGFAPVAVASDSISATTTSNAKSLTAVPTVWATNQGSVPVCVEWGASPAVAAFPCPQSKQITGGQTGTFAVLGAASFAAITQSGSATLALVEGYLAPVLHGP